MSWQVKGLNEKGELSWERDRGNDTEMAENWMLLSTYQRHGIEFDQIEEDV